MNSISFAFSLLFIFIFFLCVSCFYYYFYFSFSFSILKYKHWEDEKEVDGIKEFRIMGLSINDSVYSCVFFFLTGLHFFHLVVGLLLLSLLSWSCSFSSRAHRNNSKKRKEDYQPWKRELSSTVDHELDDVNQQLLDEEFIGLEI